MTPSVITFCPLSEVVTLVFPHRNVIVVIPMTSFPHQSYCTHSTLTILINTSCWCYHTLTAPVFHQYSLLLTCFLFYLLTQTHGCIAPSRVCGGLQLTEDPALYEF